MKEKQQEETSVYEQVRYKKQLGLLTVTPGGLAFASSSSSSSPPVVVVAWSSLLKHQVSPASYPKALLKLILAEKQHLTFQFFERAQLERIRVEITQRLRRQQQQQQHKRGQKRSYESSSAAAAAAAGYYGGPLDSTALAVTRASLLAAHPSLRQQHYHLVQETQTVTEDDFWETHQDAVQEEYARISGIAVAGTSSLLQSHLPLGGGTTSSSNDGSGSFGRITLGVEEMRQIFILYPAVHKAYEEKVPLELSDEQFWRKYLESEYFHRDRGRMGTAARNHAGVDAAAASSSSDQKNSTGPSVEQQEARAAAVGTDDFFSRYDQKLRQGKASDADTSDSELHRHRQWGRKLAVGQFDLASTFETERGRLLEGPRDNHPPNPGDDDGKGSRVIQKYNRHWAMVLHPEQAVAGADLTDVARRSVQQVLPDNSDAEPSGGVDEEMRRLVDFAQATEEEANHAAGIGHEDFAPLRLKNVEAYFQAAKQSSNATKVSDDEANKRYEVFSKALAAKTQTLVKGLTTTKEEEKTTLSNKCFPPAKLGRKLLSALTEKMALDSRTESASLEMVNKLPEDFRTRLKAYFRRSSELLRHFFGLRRLEAQGSSGHSQKLARIVPGMETFYREMEVMRKELPQTETGELMRKMCLPIMGQLDWAFQLHREGSGGGGGGGFVEVEENY